MTEQIRTVVDFLGILGIPTIFAMVVWCTKECVKFANRIDILHAAQKAQMRSQLLEKYYVIKDRGFVWADELDDWVNQHDAYLALVGKNGVLDARKAEIMLMTSKVR